MSTSRAWSAPAPRRAVPDLPSLAGGELHLDTPVARLSHRSDLEPRRCDGTAEDPRTASPPRMIARDFTVEEFARNGAKRHACEPFAGRFTGPWEGRRPGARR